MQSLTVVLPAKNELQGLKQVLPELRSCLPTAQIIVVDDGSTDESASFCREVGVTVISHPYSKGNGASIKTGVRHATGDIIVLMDADGQHRPAEIPALLEKMAQGYDMVVGARSRDGQASSARALGNRVYNGLSSWMVGHTISDLTSGFRAVKRSIISEFLTLLPNGFSYPTTITMALFRAGYSVAYVPIVVKERLGKSHLKLLNDGLRFLLIIFKIGTLYSPLKIFTPISFSFFLLGISYYGYSYYHWSLFTNMSALLFVTSIMIFLMGLISEQVTSLLYKED